MRVWYFQRCLVVFLRYHANSSGNKKTTIGNTEDCRLTTLVNSTSTAPPIGLPSKGANFCHTSNILLVGHQCRIALWQLYFNSSEVGRLVGWALVGWSTIKIAMLEEVSLQKDKWYNMEMQRSQNWVVLFCWFTAFDSQPVCKFDAQTETHWSKND